jgi:hypothetical protein
MFLPYAVHAGIYHHHHHLFLFFSRVSVVMGMVVAMVIFVL